jgi:ribosomal protein S18 acetylase RimI-like enzyme
MSSGSLGSSSALDDPRPCWRSHAGGAVVYAARVIELRDTQTIDLDALARLRARCGFAPKPADFLQAQIDGSRWVVHARDGATLVGFARAISDGIATAYLSSVMVDPDYRRRGIGRLLVEHLVQNRDSIKFVLHTRPDATAFYAALGFTAATDMMVRERRGHSIP